MMRGCQDCSPSTAARQHTLFNPYPSGSLQFTGTVAILQLSPRGQWVNPKCQHSNHNNVDGFVQHCGNSSASAMELPQSCTLTHWGRVTHICVSELSIIGSDNGLSPGRRRAIIWTNDGILLIWPLVPNFSEILIEIHSFSFKKMHLKMSSAKWRPFVSASMC